VSVIGPWYMDMTFCSDDKCLVTECYRHPAHLVNNTEDIPVAVSAFTSCTKREHKDDNTSSGRL